MARLGHSGAFLQFPVDAAADSGILPQAIRRHLLEEAKPLRLSAGDVLFRKGDRGNDCFLVRRGVIKASMKSSRGEQRILALHGPGALIGELALLDALPRAVTAEALVDSELSSISRASFLACLEQRPELNTYLIAMLATRLRRAGEETAAETLLPVTARVARVMLRLSRLFGQPAGPGRVAIEPLLLPADIGAMAGVAPEAVGCTFDDWRQSGIVTGNGQFEFIVDLEALEAEAAKEG